MDKKGKIIISGLILFLLSIITFIWYQITKLINANWVYAGAKVSEVSLQSVKLRIYMKVENPSLLSVTVTNQSYDAYVNNNLLSRIVNNKPFTIESGNSYMPLDIEIKLSDAIKAGAKNLLDLLYNQSNVKIAIKGTYQLKVLGLDIKNLPFETSFGLTQLTK
jgi:LEA14-like dessication related protein